MLKPYQVAAVERIVGPMRGRALLALEQGLGKTCVALHAAARLGGPVLVVCPANLRVGWQREAQRWVAMELSIVDDVAKLGDACVMSYDLFRRHKAAQAKPWRVVILDECHRIKSHTAQQTQLLTPVLARAPHVLLLSGTPQLSRPEELYTQLNAVAPGHFGSYYGFTARYCGGERGRFGWECVGATNVEELREKMAPFVIRELKDSVLDLPPKTRFKVDIALDADAVAQLRTMRRHLVHLRQNAERGSSFDKNAAESYFMGCWRATGQFKTAAVCDWLRGLFERRPGEKVVVFLHHKALMDAVEEAFRETRVVVRIDGNTKTARRQEHIDALRDGAADLGILSLTACGAGITLAPGVYIAVLPELPWTPAMAVQAEDRCHRLGAVRPVECYYLVATGSFDADVFAMLERKVRQRPAAPDAQQASRNADVIDAADSAFTFDD